MKAKRSLENEMCIFILLLYFCALNYINNEGIHIRSIGSCGRQLPEAF